MKDIGFFIFILVYSACTYSCDETVLPADNKEFVKQFSLDLDVIEKTIGNGKKFTVDKNEKNTIIKMINDDISSVNAFSSRLPYIYEISSKEQRNELRNCKIGAIYDDFALYGKEIEKYRECMLKGCDKQSYIYSKMMLIDEISSKNIAQCKKAIDAIK